MRPLTTSGHPNYSCGRHGDCLLTGATVPLEFLASEFPTNEVQVEIDPPEGDQLTLGFELASVR